MREPTIPATDSALLVPARFCGPTSSGNGGYTAGLLAERLAQDQPAGDAHTDCRVVEVTLRKPPPLDTSMTVEYDERGPDRPPSARLLLGDTLVAEARCTEDDLEPVEEVSAARAAEASTRYPGLRSHPFPRCFACGPEREEGDGLRIFPGQVDPPTGAATGPPTGGVRDGVVAATWRPHESLAESSDLLDPGVAVVSLGTTWAALDCVGGWSTDLEGRPMVLGRIAARVDAHPVVGDTHVVVGRALGSEGRKTFTASTIYDADGRIVARARHTWVAVDPTAF